MSGFFDKLRSRLARASVGPAEHEQSQCSVTDVRSLALIMPDEVNGGETIDSGDERLHQTQEMSSHDIYCLARNMLLLPKILTLAAVGWQPEGA